MAGPDLVSSDVNGAPLLTDEANPVGYSMQDISADGRYVLLSNFATATFLGFGQIPVQPETCRILRKDRVTGELLTVFETPPGIFGFCSNAKISADGNIVVTSPSGPVVSCVDGGEVTALIARNIAAGTDTEVKTFWQPPPGDISRICIGNGGLSFPGMPIQSITGDARFAVVVNGSVLNGSALLPNYELIDVANSTIEPIELHTEEDIIPEVYSVAVSEDGNKLALYVQLFSPSFVGVGDSQMKGGALIPIWTNTFVQQAAGYLGDAALAGAQLDDMGAQIDAMMAQFPDAQYIVSNAGVNDIGANVTLDVMKTRLQTYVLDKADFYGARVLMLTVPGYGSTNKENQILQWNEYLRQLHYTGVLDLLDIWPLLGEPTDPNTLASPTYDQPLHLKPTGDGLHYNNAAHDLIAPLLSAKLANIDLPPNPGIPSEGPVICDQTGRCEPAPVGESPDFECPESSSYWCYGYEPVPSTRAIYIIDRIADTQFVPEALSELSDGTVLQGNAWSADGSRLSWLEGPIFPIGKCFSSFPGDEPDCLLTEGCSADECELRVHHYNFSADLRTTQQTTYDPETLSGCRAIPTPENYQAETTRLGCVPRLSRDGNKLLYGRAVTHPFGGDWQPSYGLNDISYTCVSQESLAAGEPEFVECPTPQGPIIMDPGATPNDPDCITEPNSPLCQFGGVDSGLLNNYFAEGNGENGELGQYDLNNPLFNNQYNKEVVSFYTGAQPADGPIFGPGWINLTSYSAPVIWYVLDLETNHTSLVSITDKGQLFQSNGALFSDDGTTVVFNSQDPRLQSNDPEALAATEATFDEACFWSPAGSSSNLRVATNDNVAFSTEDGINIYRETPVFCPVPDPALAAHIFAGDIAGGVDLFVKNRKDGRNGKGAMKTLVGNFSRSNATMVTLKIEVSGIGEDGTVFVEEGHDCEAYVPVAATSSDDSILIRCEFAALGSHQFLPVRWRISSNSSAPSRSRATIRTSIESNEYELRPRNNVDVDLIRLPRARPDKRRPR